MADEAWLAIWKDIGEETDYTVYLNEQTANQAVGEAIGALAKSELETIEFDEEEADKLRAIIQAASETRWSDVISGWDEWRDEMGPLDNDVELVKVTLFS